MSDYSPVDVSSTRLFRLAQTRRQPPTAAPAPNGTGSRQRDDSERCDLCATPIAPTHRHLLNVSERRLVCACPACATLFPGRNAGGHQYRLIPDRVRRLEDVELNDVAWAELAIPVDIAFFFQDTAAGRTVALYPSAVGVTESRLSLDTWGAIAMRSPTIASLEPDVEALLVNRTRGAREEWAVPIDRCYRLAGLIRQHWKGLGGGDEVWKHVEAFFDELRGARRA
ncbi:MAG TPA: DUF5947 family protein [Gemmatimonadaceae bacterium]|jgi:hypothetical protein